MLAFQMISLCEIVMGQIDRITITDGEADADRSANQDARFRRDGA